MLLTKSLFIKINQGNLGYYNRVLKNKFSKDEIIEVPIEFISKRLNEKVDVCCDICGIKSEVYYSSYNMCLKYGFYSCIKCKRIKQKITNMEKYGNENYRDISKMKKTKLEKYGNENYNNHLKAEKTCLEKYGVDNVSKIESVKELKKETNLKNWGVENVFQSEEIKNRNKETHLKNLGVDHPSKSEYIKSKKIETCNKSLGVDYPTQSNLTINKIRFSNLKKYGVDWITKTEKYKKDIQKFNFEKYGVSWYMSSIDFKSKSKSKNNELYGCDFPAQNFEIFQKQQKSGFGSKIYNNIYYRGSYELDFLKFCEMKNIKVLNGPTIKYILNSKDKIYYPDFYLPEYNLICEIKSLYYYEKYLEINNIKKSATELLNYKFLFIIDKKYDDIIELIR